MSIKNLLDGRDKTSFTIDATVEFINNVIIDDDLTISGTLTGNGYTNNTLLNDNVWTGSNEFQGVVEIGAGDGTSNNNDNEIQTKADVDAMVGANSVLTTDNTFPLLQTFQAEVQVPESGADIGDNVLINKNDFDTYITTNLQLPNEAEENTFTGTNTFTNAIISNSEGTDDYQAVSKEYIDTAILLGGKCVSNTFDTPGTYYHSIPDYDIGTLVKLDIICWSGGLNGHCSGAMSTLSVGDMNDLLSSLEIKVGDVEETSNTYTGASGSELLSVPSTSYVKYGGAYLNICWGAYRKDNQDGTYTNTPGSAYRPSGQDAFSGFYVDGVSADHPFYNATKGYGETTSSGYITIISHYA